MIVSKKGPLSKGSNNPFRSAHILHLAPLLPSHSSEPVAPSIVQSLGVGRKRADAEFARERMLNGTSRVCLRNIWVCLQMG